ncbi:MAG: hypothetical protein A2086_07225 [Spirochaetes bacterium GWD1_27_9]|nr:MAG: hypothetical protein A2Z98_11670 [Spirochaetes bacterium GWB1_27_13]OHD25699.1 MAG: hypothetical protein A2Y34_14380 [Spirochaetes bacterium GWC1_27_15]OHD32192.1 MAG: hypothetical protein A2086_07225 [Spirochaetes bacterium GWD1_27_9]
MKIGITYDLRDDYIKRGFSLEQTAEFDPIETINGIDNAIKLCGFETERIGNVRHLVEKLNLGKKWDIIFNICEGLNGTCRESLVPSILDEYGIPYTFSDPFVLALTLDKALTKMVVKNAGIKTADFFVVNSISDLDGLNLTYPLFVKPLREGSGKGIDSKSKVYDFGSLKEKCISILKNFNQPALVEKFLVGKDFTVSILGNGSDTRVIDVTNLFITKDGKEDYFSYENKENLFVEYKSAEKEDFIKCSELAIKAWKVLGCRDGGRIDVRYDENEIPHFIEVNPLPEINPEYSELTNACKKKGISYNEMIKIILHSALKRVNN